MHRHKYPVLWACLVNSLFAASSTTYHDKHLCRSSHKLLYSKW